MAKRLAVFMTAVTLALITNAGQGRAYDGVVEKKTFTLASFTIGGKTIKEVRIGWESYGALNAEKSNAILITHYFSGTSHAAGKYKPGDTAAGHGHLDGVLATGQAEDKIRAFLEGK